MRGERKRSQVLSSTFTSSESDMIMLLRKWGGALTSCSWAKHACSHGMGALKYTGLTVSEEIPLSRHVVRKNSTADAHRPEELVDVIWAVSSKTWSYRHMSIRKWRVNHVCHWFRREGKRENVLSKWDILYLRRPRERSRRLDSLRWGKPLPR